MSFGAALSLSLVAAGGVLMAFRLLCGPTLPDRVLAADSLIMLITMSVALYIVFFPDEADPYVDVMLLISVLGFLGTTALARFVERQREGNGEEEVS